MQFLHRHYSVSGCLNILIICYQVIIAFGDPEFFNTVFPMLHEMCNTASVRMSSQVQTASDAVKTGCYTTNVQSRELHRIIC